MQIQKLDTVAKAGSENFSLISELASRACPSEIKKSPGNEVAKLNYPIRHDVFVDQSIFSLATSLANSLRVKKLTFRALALRQVSGTCERVTIKAFRKSTL